MKLSKRLFGWKAPASKYPPSLRDRYEISAIDKVPAHIPRPWYVGKKP